MVVLSFIPAGANLRSCQHHDAILCNKFGNLESSFNLSLLGDVTVQF